MSPARMPTRFGDVAAVTTDHQKPLEGEGKPRTVPQEMFESLEVARHHTIDEADANRRIDGEAAVLPGEHVGGRIWIEKALSHEQPHDAASHSFGDSREILSIHRLGGKEGGHPAGDCCNAGDKPRSHDTSRIAMAKLMNRVAEEFPL